MAHFFSIITGWLVLLGVAGAFITHDILAVYGLAYATLVLGHDLHWYVYTDNPLHMLRIGMMPVLVVVAWHTIRERGGFARYGWTIPCGIGVPCFVYLGGIGWAL